MLKRFEFWNNGKKIELQVLDKITDTKIKVNVTVDGNEIASEAIASICRINGEPSKLYLQIDNTYLCICDKSKSGSVEKNREIADWIWTNIQNSDNLANTYSFTTEHWKNWEE